MSFAGIYVSIPTLVSNFIQFNIWGIAMNFLLTRRFGKFKTFLLLQPIILVIVFAPLFLPYLSVWRAIFGLFTWALPLLLYSDRLGKKLVVFVICTLTTMLVEMWISVVLPPDVIAAGISAQPIAYQCGIYAVYDSSTAVLLALATLAFKRFEKKYQNNLSLRNWLSFGLFPLSQYVLLCGWFSEFALEDFSYSNLIFMLTAELICLAADVLLYFSITNIANRSRLATENEMLIKQIDSQKAHYAALTNQYEDIRRMRHDISNHIFTINLLLKERRSEEAAAYAEELKKETDYSPQIGQCRNPVTDAFLYARSKELEEKGVSLDLHVNVPRIPQISNIHMVSALGNLLDNAAEAALKCEKPWIKLFANYVKGYLIIEVSNPVPPVLPTAEKKRRIPELPRGVGTHILTEIAEIYSGQYTAHEQAGVFLATLTLRGENENAASSDM